MKQAPSFPSGNPGWRSNRYPLGGARSGPAWQAMWARLQEAGDEFVADKELREIGASAGSCSESTAKQILITARKADILERKLVPGGVPFRTRVFYRIVAAHR